MCVFSFFFFFLKKKALSQILTFNIFSHNGTHECRNQFIQFSAKKQANKNRASGLTSCMPRFSQM